MFKNHVNERHVKGRTGELKKRIFITTLPIAAQNLISFASSFIDSLMVSPLGTDAVGGVYAGSEIQRLLRYLAIGIESAVLIAGSSALGRGSRRDASKIGAYGIIIATSAAIATTLFCFFFPSPVLSLFSSEEKIIFAGAEYLRISSLSFPLFCLSDTLVSRDRCLGGKGAGPVSTGISLGVSVLFNFILIKGAFGVPPLGVRGAAISSLLSRLAQLLSLLLFFLIRKRIRTKCVAHTSSEGASADMGEHRVERDAQKCVAAAKTAESSPESEGKLDTPHHRGPFSELLRTALPTVSAQLIWGGYMMLSAAIMTDLTETGAAAAAGIAAAAYNLMMAPTAGYTAALSMLAGKARGQGDSKLLDELRSLSGRISIVIGITISLLTLTFSRPFISIYSVDKEAFGVAASLLFILVLTLPFSAYESPALYGVLRGSGDAPFVLFTDLIVLFGLVLPSAILAADLAAPSFFIYALLRSEAVIKSLVALLRLKNLSKKVGEKKTSSTKEAGQRSDK